MNDTQRKLRELADRIDALSNWRQLVHAQRQAKLAADLIVQFSEDPACKGRMCGYLDDSCTAADIAAKDLEQLLSAAPSQAEQDAARYRYLRDNSATYTSPKVPIQLIVQECADVHRTHGATGYRLGLDEAIDALIDEAPSQVEPLGPASPEDMRVYDDIAAGWRGGAGLAGRVLEIAGRTLTDEQADRIKAEIAARLAAWSAVSPQAAASLVNDAWSAATSLGPVTQSELRAALDGDSKP